MRVTDVALLLLVTTVTASACTGTFGGCEGTKYCCGSCTCSGGKCTPGSSGSCGKPSPTPSPPPAPKPTPPVPSPPLPPSSSVTVSVDLSVSFITVDQRYVSITVEGCKAVVEDKIDLASPLLRQLTRNLAPALLRFGGSCNDCVRYNVGGDAPKFGNKPESKYCSGPFYLTQDRWDRILAFSNATGLQLIFGLNTCFQRGYSQPIPAWDPSNAEMLMNYTKQHPCGGQVAGWEMGNEIENADKWGPTNGILDQPALVASDWDTLKKTVKQVFGVMPLSHKGATNAVGGLQLFGPDMKAEMSFLTPFSALTDDIIDHGTWHYYLFKKGRKVEISDIFDAANLDQVVHWRAAPFAKVFKGRSWVGEYSGSEGGGLIGITDRFADAFWNADQLGLLPYYGVQGQMRQTLTENALGILSAPGNNYTPRPTYYMYLVWKQLMGTKMLNTTHSAHHNVSVLGTSATKLRAYAACHTLGNGAVTVLVLNLGPSTLQVVLPQAATERTEWVLTGKSGDPAASIVLLNGQALTTDSQGHPPKLQGVPRSNKQPLMLPGQSFAFVVLQDAKAGVCY